MAYTTDYLKIRKAELSDIGKVASLLVTCFGHLAIAEGALSYFLNRYYIAVSDTGEVIGVSGIVPEDDHYTVTFTCTDPRYRNKGVMNALFDRIFKDYDKDKIITLQAWHLPDKEKANLDGLARRYGFTLVKRVVKSREKGITSSCEECIYSNKDKCHCFEDLYIRNT